MKAKIIYLIVGVIVIGLGIYFVSGYKSQAPAVTKEDSQSSSQSPANQANNPAANQTASQSPGTQAPPQAGSDPTKHFSDESDIDGNDVSVKEVDYDGAKFIPAAISIKLGDIVIFKNKSSTDFWPASNPHPTHTDYPGFDAKASLGPGQSFQFKFEKIGSWGYHNHLNPSQGGTINVSQ